jgi:8-oxo-dGTP pyrophosphatase MutT (NUDIX family)
MRAAKLRAPIAEPDREPRGQSAALPWRRSPTGEVEVMLITSRDTRRWVIPKGWPIKGLNSRGTAAQEAFEEAGLIGQIAKKPIGTFHYDKRLRSGRVQHVRVTVFPLQVTEERAVWPELGQREKLWVAPAQAGAMVDEPELQTLIVAFQGGPKACLNSAPAHP